MHAGDPAHSGGAKAALVFGILLLFCGVLALVSKFIIGVAWWQFWPLALVIVGIVQLVVSGLAVGIVTIVAAIATVARGGLAAAFVVKAIGIGAFGLGILRLIVTRCDIFCRCARNKLYRVLRQIVRHIRALDNLDALNDLVLRFILLKNQTHESNLSDNQQTAPWSQ